MRQENPFRQWLEADTYGGTWVALDAHTRALEVKVTVYGAEHPSIAITLANVGLVSYELGDEETGCEAVARALPMAERFYGRGHPETERIRHLFSEFGCEGSRTRG
jgi:hypothetical protein